jgi:hypothetical protein
MTLALVIAGIVFLLIGWVFFWFNLNSPLQTRIPAFALPIGIVALLLALGRVLP